MGQGSLGADRPDPYRVVLDMGFGNLGIALPYGSRHLRPLFRETESVRE